MAARYRKIDPRIWDDEKFRALSRDGRDVAFYLLTSPQSNRIGIYKLSPAMASETIPGFDLKTFAKGLREVCAGFGWDFDDRARVLYIDTWWKYNQPENPKVLKGNLKDLHDIPQTTLLKKFSDNFQYLTDNLLGTFKECIREHTGYVLPNVSDPITRSETRAEAGSRSGAETGLFAPPSKEGEAAPAETVLEYETIPGAKNKDRIFYLTRDKLAEYRTTYPGVDVEAEARKAWQYLRDNPQYRKTRDGMPDYLRRWLQRAQNGSGRGGESRASQRNAEISRSLRESAR